MLITSLLRVRFGVMLKWCEWEIQGRVHKTTAYISQLNFPLWAWTAGLFMRQFVYETRDEVICGPRNQGTIANRHQIDHLVIMKKFWLLITIKKIKNILLEKVFRSQKNCEKTVKLFYFNIQYLGTINLSILLYKLQSLIGNPWVIQALTWVGLI